VAGDGTATRRRFLPPTLGILTGYVSASEDLAWSPGDSPVTWLRSNLIDDRLPDNLSSLPL